MRARFAICVIIILGVSASVHAADSDNHAQIDSFHFLAGLSVVGADMGYIAPPQCESFFREGGELRAAELFLDAAQTWTKNASSPTAAIQYFERGKRFVIAHRTLSEAMREFYASPKGTGSTELGLIRLERQKRLSFIAGIYARSYRDGAFHGSPSPAMRATVLILLAEGCQVSDLTFSEHQVPDTMHFKVKPSEPIAQLFAIVDQWRPTHVEWQLK